MTKTSHPIQFSSQTLDKLRKIWHETPAAEAQKVEPKVLTIKADTKDLIKKLVDKRSEGKMALRDDNTISLGIGKVPIDKRFIVIMATEWDDGVDEVKHRMGVVESEKAVEEFLMKYWEKENDYRCWPVLIFDVVKAEEYVMQRKVSGGVVSILNKGPKAKKKAGNPQKTASKTAARKIAKKR